MHTLRRRLHLTPYQAGARVQQVVDALVPHNLTLQNYASINEQQLGGFLQVRSKHVTALLAERRVP